MWVVTDEGDLVNLDRASGVQLVETDEGAEIVAVIDGRMTSLRSIPDMDSARAAFNSLKSNLKALGI